MNEAHYWIATCEDDGIQTAVKTEGDHGKDPVPSILTVMCIGCKKLVLLKEVDATTYQEFVLEDDDGDD
jgi:hypothetical protein